MSQVTDFSVPDSLSNVVLVVEGKKMHVNKEILAFHSPVFEAMLLGDFAEAKNEEILLNSPEPLKYIEFLDFIQLLYQSSGKMNYNTLDNTYKYLLKLADFYQVEFMVRKCDEFLAMDNVPFVEKLAVMSLIKHVLVFKYLLEKPEYKLVSDEFRAEMYEELILSIVNGVPFPENSP